MHVMILGGIALFCGVMVALSQFAVHGMTVMALACAGVTALAGTILLVLRRRVGLLLQAMGVAEDTRTRFARYELAPYMVFLLYGLVLVGVRPNLAFGLLLFTLFALLTVLLLWCVAGRAQKERWLGATDAIPGLFFISGFAALIYQVVWQRVLFTTFGINIESVTVIVSVFMFGLGMGALAGGLVQKRYPERLLEWFVAIEIAIGIFGVCSIPLIRAAGALAPHDSLPALIGVVYALLALPTMLMGATLPLLVGYLQRHFGNIGKTVGKLYAYNTFGSALAAFFTVNLLFITLGQQGTLVVAGLCNVLVALWVWALCKRAGKLSEAPMPAQESAGHAKLPYGMALALSAAVGYASLSLEILWFRVIGLISGGKPQIFGLLLTVFLAGIAAGSLKAKQWSESGRDMHRFMTRSLVWLMVSAYVSLALAGLIAQLAGKPAGLLAAYAATGLLAYFSGGIFPALCHMGISPRSSHKPGMEVAKLYFCNIAGATIGSLLTGFVLLEYFSLTQNMAIVCVLLAATLFAWMIYAYKPKLLSRALAVAMATIALVLHPSLHGRILESLSGLTTASAYKYTHENRSGIITIEADPEGDKIYGSGAYDGRFNIDPVEDHNGIFRVYMLAALHPNPQRILQMGMSGGAAVRVLSMYKPAREVVTIEINPGYAAVLSHYPDIVPILNHPKVRLEKDDARRWLNRHPDERFDVITMNTMYFWRSNATNLLSREFLELCKRHLNPGGVLYYNSTGADDSHYTAAHVFKHVVKYTNFVAASDTPFTVSHEQRRENLLQFVDEQGNAVFKKADKRYAQVLDALSKEELVDTRDTLLAGDGLWLITDDNMASEYRIENHFLTPHLYYALWGKE